MPYVRARHLKIIGRVWGIVPIWFRRLIASVFLEIVGIGLNAESIGGLYRLIWGRRWELCSRVQEARAILSMGSLALKVQDLL
jgi:hypothetical protein